MPSPIPVAIVKVDGAAIDTNNLVHVVVTQTIGAAAHARLRLLRPHTESSSFTVGKELTVTASTPTPANDGELFKGTIVAVGFEWGAHREELIVDVYDKSYSLARKTVVADFTDSTAKDVVTQIAGENGLQCDISSTLGSTVHKSMQQWSSAHRLLTELCYEAGCDWWVEGNKLVVKRRSEAAASAITLNGDHLYRFDARFSAMDQTSEVNIRGWDPASKQEIVGNATGVNTGGKNANGVTTTLAPAAATSWPRLVAASNSDADAIAAGIAERMGSSVLRARGEADVSAKIRPGAIAKVEGMGDWSGEYYITEAEHTYGEGEPFTTRFVAGASDDESLQGLIARRDRSGSGGSTAGLTIGIVTNNEDPDALNRVRVKYPYLSSNGESAWARLVLPGAGAERGLMVIPEVDDEVLVGFENGDMRRPYVLGGLWNGADAPPTRPATVLSGGVNNRSLTSREGHVIAIVDGDPDDAIILRLKDGSTIDLTKQKIVIEHTSDVPVTVKTTAASIEIAQGGDITMKGKKITLEAQQDVIIKGLNVKVEAQAGVEAKATAQMKLAGTAGVKIESPAMTEISGAMVKIN